MPDREEFYQTVLDGLARYLDNPFMADGAVQLVEEPFLAGHLVLVQGEMELGIGIPTYGGQHVGHEWIVEIARQAIHGHRRAGRVDIEAHGPVDVEPAVVQQHGGQHAIPAAENMYRSQPAADGAVEFVEELFLAGHLVLVQG